MRKTLAFVGVYLVVAALLWGARGVGGAIGVFIFCGGMGLAVGAIRGRAHGGFRLGSVLGIPLLIGYMASDPESSAASLLTHLQGVTVV